MSGCLLQTQILAYHLASQNNGYCIMMLLELYANSLGLADHLGYWAIKANMNENHCLSQC